MKRRTLLQCLAAGLAGAGAAGGLLTVAYRHEGACPALPLSLAELADERFLHALPALSTETLLARLEAAGVVSQECLDLERLAADAESHPVVAFAGYHYTEPELMLYVLAARLGRHPATAYAYERKRRLDALDDLAWATGCSVALLKWQADPLSVALASDAAAAAPDLQCSDMGRVFPKHLRDKAALDADLPDYVLASAAQGAELPDADIAIIDRRLNPIGYQIVRRRPQAAIYARAAN